MHTFPATPSGPIVQTNAAKKPRGAGAIMARALGRFALGAALLLTLSACSTIRLAYNQAPNLSYWWINDYADLSEAQSAPFRKDLDAFFAWHRAEELPLYTERLKQWQTIATQDITPASACAQFEATRAAYLRGAERALPPLTRVALGLKGPQFEALAKKHAKSNEKFEKEWLSGTKEERLERRLDKATERYEDLYGKLNAPQRQLLKRLALRNGFDPARTQAERLRRQADLTDSLKQAQAQPEKAQAILRDWHARVMRSPDAAYAAYSEANIQDNCAQFAALHNTSSPEQRAQAVKTLQRYEGDLLALQRAD
jgi:hypothetical protein